MNVRFLCHYSFLLTEKIFLLIFLFIILSFASHSISSKFPYAHRLFLTSITNFLCFVLILSRNIETPHHLGNKGSSPDIFHLRIPDSKECNISSCDRRQVLYDIIPIHMHSSAKKDSIWCESSWGSNSSWIRWDIYLSTWVWRTC